MPNYSELPEISAITDNDFITIWDVDTLTTRKITASNLKSYFGATAVIISNISNQSTATASSQFSGSFSPTNAIDGNTSTEWASAGQVNPWIQLTFSTSKTVQRVRLADRTNLTDAANAGTLTFSDGSSVNVTGIANNGSFSTVDFSARSITWVRFTVTAGSGSNVGLSEFEVWGY